MVRKYIKLNDDIKNPNDVIRIWVEHVPLLFGQVQVGTMYSYQQELLIEKLLIGELTFSQKESITCLKKILIDNEWRLSRYIDTEIQLFDHLVTDH